MGTGPAGDTDDDAPRRLEKRAALAAVLAPWSILFGLTILALPIAFLTFVAAGLAAFKAMSGRPGLARNWFGGVILGAVSTMFMATPNVEGAVQSLLALAFLFGWPIGWSIVGVVATSQAEAHRRLTWGRAYRARLDATAARQRPQPPTPPGPIAAPPPPSAPPPRPATTQHDDDLAYLDALADVDDDGPR